MTDWELGYNFLSFVQLIQNLIYMLFPGYLKAPLMAGGG